MRRSGIPGCMGNIGAVQRLDLGLLVQAQHDRVRRRRQIQAHDVGDLGDQFGVGGERERLRSAGSDAVLSQGAGDGGVPDLQMAGEEPVDEVTTRRRQASQRGPGRQRVLTPRRRRCMSTGPDAPACAKCSAPLDGWNPACSRCGYVAGASPLTTPPPAPPTGETTATSPAVWSPPVYNQVPPPHWRDFSVPHQQQHRRSNSRLTASRHTNRRLTATRHTDR